MATIEALRTCVGRLPASKQEFAHSLLSQWDRKRRLSDKQWPWVERLVKLAEEGEKPRETHEVGDMGGAIALFDKAGEHLKHPAVILQLNEQKEAEPGWAAPFKEATYIRLSVAGATARVPGSLNVTDYVKDGDRTWYGRILRDGRFEKSPREDMPAGLVELLKRFATEPAAVAGEQGRLTGRCCFCNTALADERSTAVGYGPTCSRHFGLHEQWKNALKAAR